MSTQYESDLRPPEPVSELAVLVSQNPDRVTYVVRDMNKWSIHVVDVATGVARTGQSTYTCFLEATRAFRAGAVIWEG